MQLMAKTAQRGWYRPAVDHANFVCLNCGPPPTTLRSSAHLSVGFGTVQVTKDDECVWAGDDWDVTALRFTRQANKDPEHDWRIEFVGPMHGETYQHQNGKWVMVETNLGFA
jgi:hypothetical protein